MDFFVFAMVIAAAFIGGIVYTIINSDKKARAKLSASFGKPPEDTDCEFESIGRYFRYKSEAVNNESRIDSITWNDLDMDKLFSRINNCQTSVGEEYLYSVLHETEADNARLLEREKFIAYMSEHPDKRLEIQMVLRGMGKSNYNGLSSLIFKADVKSSRYPFVYKILAVTPIVCALAIILNAAVGIPLLAVAFIVNIAAYYLGGKKIETELPAVKYFSSMLSCCARLCRMKDMEVQPLFAGLQQVFPVFKSLVGKASGMLKMPATEMEAILEYFKILFLIDIRNYNKVIHRISAHTEECHRLFMLTGEIDMSISILSFRESLPYFCTPRFHGENSVLFNEVYHPLLPSPVANNGVIGNDSLITGSNASGKTTFIKALAVNAILAQTIHTCAAKEFALRFSLVMTSMALRDNLSEGESYFIVEIKSLKRIFDKLKTVSCTCFIDEILRGTNTIERIAASASVLKHLHDKDCLCVAASHDIELTNILNGVFDNYNFCEQITDDGLFFDYKLKHGASKTKNAIKLLGYMGFENSITEDAEDMISFFESTKIWRGLNEHPNE